MADALGTPGGVVSDEDHRLAIAGMIAAQSSTLAVRTGVMFGPGATSIVTGTSATGTMTVNFGACHWVTTRATGDGIYIGTKETSTTVNIAAAPGANSRIDVVYAKQNDAGSTISPDGSTGELYGVVTGTAAAVPTKPALPVGAVEIATVTVAVGATNTLGAGVTIANTAGLVVARGAPIPVRNTTERNALTGFTGLHVVRLDNSGKLEYWVSGTTWATYDVTQLPARERRVVATAGGTLASGVSVNIAAAQTLPASPAGTGINYVIKPRGQIQVSIPSGLGATLSVTVGATTYEIDRFTNSGTSMTYTLRGDDIFPITGGTAQTVSVFVTALAGTITVISTGSITIETLPNGTTL
jgi:hypothetical protein